MFFDKFQNVMEEKVVPVATRIASQKHLSALRDGLTILIPFTVIGGISLMIANPPVDLEVMKPTNFFFQFMIMWKNWATDWATLLTIPFHLTIGIISVYVVLGISYRFSKYYKMEALPNSLTALFVFLCVAGVPQSINEGSFIDVSGLGASSMFAAIIIAILVVMVVLVCFLQDGERRIPVQYSQKVSGRKTFGGQSTNIPLKVNTAGVMPVIFASSLMQFPVIIAQLFGKSYEWTRYLSSSYWCRISAPKYSIGLILYIVLLIIFAYFYTSITFNPIEVADNLKKAGGVIPGITPGKSTSDYLNNILNYIVFVGAVGLLIIALIPIMCTGFFNASVSFGGTSVIIIVGVVLETLKQIESQMVNRYYKGFLSE